MVTNLQQRNLRQNQQIEPSVLRHILTNEVPVAVNLLING